MSDSKDQLLSRRAFLWTTAAASALPSAFLTSCRTAISQPITRQLGRTGLEVTTLGLGGQASLQWTPDGVDPDRIILKASGLGVNYFDTSNVYGSSQLNYGKAFRTLHLIPGEPGYDEAKRRSIVLASKTMVRHAKGWHPDVRDRSNGPEGSTAVDDLKRSLVQMFGDGGREYPAGAYLDVFQIHNLNTMEEVEAIYEGLDNTDPQADRIGAFAALRDYRDGTDRTGLNPKEERLIHHIGITGHISSPVMMECIQRDSEDLIDTMLIAINANDRRYFSHQYNAIPVAVAKNMGIIAMKVFADGAMYTKEPRWSRTPDDVVMTVGSPALRSQPLVQYALSTPGIATAIIGTGRIDVDPRFCQLTQNLAASQIIPSDLRESDRTEIEQGAMAAKNGQANYFQLPAEPLGAPREATVVQERRDERRFARVTWQTAYAGDRPIRLYEVWRDNQKVGEVPHQPQTTKSPFHYEDELAGRTSHVYRVVTVDVNGRNASSEECRVSATA
jgi:aryl-alcohol dehydrogenase-like predicted oxidoreductase